MPSKLAGMRSEGEGGEEVTEEIIWAKMEENQRG